MNKRPLSVTIVSCILLAAGLIGFAYHLQEFNPNQPLENDAILVLLVRVIAVICGIYLLRGSNWARWLALGWIGYHVILSAFHSLSELATHGVLFAVFALFLFRPSAARYFRAPGTEAP